MKAGYQKPTIVFEDFELNTAIALGCTVVVSMGPSTPDGIEACDEYKGYEELRVKPGISVMSDEPDPSSQPFYEGSCSCYLSSAGGTLFTS